MLRRCSAPKRCSAARNSFLPPLFARDPQQMHEKERIGGRAKGIDEASRNRTWALRVVSAHACHYTIDPCDEWLGITAAKTIYKVLVKVPVMTTLLSDFHAHIRCDLVAFPKNQLDCRIKAVAFAVVLPIFAGISEWRHTVVNTVRESQQLPSMSICRVLLIHTGRSWLSRRHGKT